MLSMMFQYIPVGMLRVSQHTNESLLRTCINGAYVMLIKYESKIVIMNC